MPGMGPGSRLARPLVASAAFAVLVGCGTVRTTTESADAAVIPVDLGVLSDMSLQLGEAGGTDRVPIAGIGIDGSEDRSALAFVRAGKVELMPSLPTEDRQYAVSMKSHEDGAVLVGMFCSDRIRLDAEGSYQCDATTNWQVWNLARGQWTRVAVYKEPRLLVEANETAAVVEDSAFGREVVALSPATPTLTAAPRDRRAAGGYCALGGDDIVIENGGTQAVVSGPDGVTRTVELAQPLRPIGMYGAVPPGTGFQCTFTGRYLIISGTPTIESLAALVPSDMRPTATPAPVANEQSTGSPSSLASATPPDAQSRIIDLLDPSAPPRAFGSSTPIERVFFAGELWGWTDAEGIHYATGSRDKVVTVSLPASPGRPTILATADTLYVVYHGGSGYPSTVDAVMTGAR